MWASVRSAARAPAGWREEKGGMCIRKQEAQSGCSNRVKVLLLLRWKRSEGWEGRVVVCGCDRLTTARGMA